MWFGTKSAAVNAEEYMLSAIWKTYAYWAFWVGVAFFSIYPSCNFISAQRSHIYLFYFEKELMVPFVPEFFWVYISMYLLFLLPPFFLSVSELKLLGKRIIVGTLISGIIFLIFPSQLGFERIAPDGFYGEIYAQIFSLDMPHNMVPSLHIVYSGFILLSINTASCEKSIRLFAILWLLLISLSTLLVHQHHIADIISAMMIVWLVNTKIIKGNNNV